MADTDSQKKKQPAPSSTHHATSSSSHTFSQDADNIDISALEESLDVPAPQPELKKTTHKKRKPTRKPAPAKETTAAETTDSTKRKPNINIKSNDNMLGGIEDITAYINQRKQASHAPDPETTATSLTAQDGTDLVSLPELYAIVPHAKGDHKLVYLTANAPTNLQEDPRKRVKGGIYEKKGLKIYDVKLVMKEHPTLKGPGGENMDVWVIDTPEELEQQLKAIAQGKGGGENFSAPLVIATDDSSPAQAPQAAAVSIPEVVQDHSEEPLTTTTPEPTPEAVGTSVQESQEAEPSAESLEPIPEEEPLPVEETPPGEEIPTQEAIGEEQVHEAEPMQQAPTEDAATLPKEKVTNLPGESEQESTDDQGSHSSSGEPFSDAEEQRLPEETVQPASDAISLDMSEEVTNETSQPSSMFSATEQETIPAAPELPAVDLSSLSRDHETADLSSSPTPEQSLPEKISEPQPELSTSTQEERNPFLHETPQEEDTPAAEELPTTDTDSPSAFTFTQPDGEPTPPAEETPMSASEAAGSFLHETTEPAAQAPEEQPSMSFSSGFSSPEATTPASSEPAVSPETPPKETTPEKTVSERLSESSSPKPTIQETAPEPLPVDNSNVLNLDEMTIEDTTSSSAGGVAPASTLPQDTPPPPKKPGIKVLGRVIRAALFVFIIIMFVLIWKVMFPPIKGIKEPTEEQPNPIVTGSTETGEVTTTGDTIVPTPTEEQPTEITSGNYTIPELRAKLEAQQTEARRLANTAKLLDNKEAIKFSLTALLKAGNILERMETETTITADEITKESTRIDLYIQKAQELIE